MKCGKISEHVYFIRSLIAQWLHHTDHIIPETYKNGTSKLPWLAISNKKQGRLLSHSQGHGFLKE